MINLSKGGKINLSKSTTAKLTTVTVGLGWDMTKSMFSFLKTNNFDCDAIAILLDNNSRLQSKEDVVYFNNLKHKSNCVRHLGDNRTGEGDGDDEQILIDLVNLPINYSKIVIAVNIYKARERNQTFGNIDNAFIRIVDSNYNELCKYNLTGEYSGKTAMLFGELRRNNNDWEFEAIGEGTYDNDINEIIQKFY